MLLWVRLGTTLIKNLIIVFFPPFNQAVSDSTGFLSPACLKFTALLFSSVGNLGAAVSIVV